MATDIKDSDRQRRAAFGAKRGPERAKEALVKDEDATTLTLTHLGEQSATGNDTDSCW